MSQQGNPPIQTLCDWAKVSRAGFYRRWHASAPRQEETAMRDRLQQLALSHRHYGYRRLGVLLRREGWAANHKRVLRLLRQDNLLCLRRKAYAPSTTNSAHGWRVFPNLVRGIQLSAINQLWVADITYVRLGEEYIYLAVVLDAYSRRVIGWALDRHLHASLALKALSMAIDSRTITPGLIHHSDRGVQYACYDYVQQLADNAITPSMSRIGNPYDNAKAESFMKTLKQEEADGRCYRTLDQARQQIGQFLELTYNLERLHSALGYHSPIDYECNLMASPILKDESPNRSLQPVP
jgi:putative transposase